MTTEHPEHERERADDAQQASHADADADADSDAESNAEYERRRSEIGTTAFGTLYDLMEGKSAAAKNFNRAQRQKAKRFEKLRPPKFAYKPPNEKTDSPQVQRMRKRNKELRDQRALAYEEIADLKRQLAEAKQEKRTALVPVDYEKLKEIYTRVEAMSRTPFEDTTGCSPRRAGIRHIWNDDDDTLGPWFRKVESMTRMVNDICKDGRVSTLILGGDLDETKFPFVADSHAAYKAIDCQPNAYDRRYGPHVNMSNLPDYDQPPTDKMPSSNPPLGPDWSSGSTALVGIDRSRPGFRWYLNKDGSPILRWDTKSRTRSRTLEFWQTLPATANFDWNQHELTVIKGRHGPAWSCFAQDTKHKRRAPIMAFGTKFCVLCTTGRIRRSRCIPHDFSVADTDTHEDQWPAAIPEVQKNKKQE